MNKQELRAITLIAKKLDWNGRPVTDVMKEIKQMVCNQQCLELDTVGECDDFEETLLSIALWDKDHILSTRTVCDYPSMLMWYDGIFKEDMGLDNNGLAVLLEYDSHCRQWTVENDEAVLEDYYDECWQSYNETIESLRYCY